MRLKFIMKKFNPILLICLLLVCFSCENNTQEQSQNEPSPEQTSIESSALSAYNRAVNPPIPSINIELNNWKMNAEKGKTISLEDGTQIIIPANAFLDTQGKLIEGEVDIKFRAFHDAADIIASGIIMSDLKNNNYMQTAGMFEIRGAQNGQEIQINPENPLTVELASFIEGDEYQFFQLEEDKKEWVDLGTAAPKPNIRKRKKLNELPPCPPKPTEPAANNPDNFVFDLEVDYKNFPELKSYHGVVWEYAGTTDETNPEKNPVVFESNWNDISLAPGDRKGTYQLTLKENKRIESKEFKTIVKPVLKGLDYDQAIARFQAKDKEYKQVFELRKSETERLSKEADLLRSFRVSNFGIFNWDIWKQPGRILCDIEPDFGDPSLNKFKKSVKLFQVTADGRSVIVYHYNDLPKFSFDPSLDNQLIAILPGNKWAVFNQADFDQLKTTVERQEGSEKQTIRFKLMEEELASLDDLKAVI